MTYKRTYSQQDIDELVAWIDTKPTGRLDLGGGIVIDDLATYTQAARHTLLTQGTKPTFSGYVHTLMQAKQAHSPVPPHANQSMSGSPLQQ